MSLQVTLDRPLRVLSVFGTRPEAIKMAPVVLALRALGDEVESRVCVTAQHREMLDDVLRLFRIEPDHDLDVMRPGQSPTAVAAEILHRLEPVLEVERPDWVLVQGDTTTAAIASLAAFYAGARVGHVEAGLRSGEPREPFPEELNRRVAAVIADLHFAPTGGARANLLREGVPAEAIVVTGNPVIDALQHAVSIADGESDLPAGLDSGERVVLVTAHRRESFGRPIESICAAIWSLANRYPDVRFVFPVHPNPAVSDVVNASLAGVPGVTLLAPLSYLELIRLLRRAYLVLTDSGGLQEEAPSLGKPVLCLRDVTERVEGVAAGTVRLIGTDPVRIVEETARLLDSAAEHDRMAQAVNPYGDGRAAGRIVEALLGNGAEVRVLPGLDVIAA
ncbi:MAG: UDP-N-acetylglucosamine 2-epimerase (non-hydrolyzing) [Gaiellales bacterium]